VISVHKCYITGDFFVAKFFVFCSTIDQSQYQS